VGLSIVQQPTAARGTPIGGGHAVGQRAEYWTLAADEEEREQAMLQHGRWLEEIGAMQEDEEAEALVRGQSVQAMRDDKTRDVKA
jgi:hypothetical protein